MRKRICFWVNSIFKLGGIKRSVTMISNMLSEKYDVTIITGDVPESENRDLYGLKLDVNIVYMNQILINNRKRRLYGRGEWGESENAYILESFFLNFEEKKYFLELLSAFECIIGVAEWGVVLATIAEYFNQTIWWQHNCLEDCLNGYKKTLFDSYILEKNIFKLDEIIVLSDIENEKFLRQFNISTRVIQNPMSFRSDTVSKLDNKIFFVAARFSYIKGLDLLIEAFSLFCEKNYDWRLVIAGDGEELQSIRKRAMECNVYDRIIFLGRICDVKRYLIEASAYLLTSRNESFGMSVVEALEIGVPIVAWDYEPINMLVTNLKEGLLVKKFDVHAFSDAMLEIATNKPLRRHMGKCAKEKAGTIAIELDILEKWVDLIG